MLKYDNLLTRLKGKKMGTISINGTTNEFNPDWPAMAVMVEEQQRMAAEIETLKRPQSPWIEFTDQEVDQFHNWKDCTWSTNELVRHVAAALKEKNT